MTKSKTELLMDKVEALACSRDRKEIPQSEFDELFYSLRAELYLEMERITNDLVWMRPWPQSKEDVDKVLDEKMGIKS